jgi:hypothetical protein
MTASAGTPSARLVGAASRLWRPSLRLCVLAVLPVILATSGCTYARARGLDLLDVASIGVGYGEGLNVHVQASELVHASLGGSQAAMYGTRGRFVGHWNEANLGWPVTFLLFGRSEHGPQRDETATGLLLLTFLVPFHDWEEVSFRGPGAVAPPPHAQQTHFCMINPLFHRYVHQPLFRGPRAKEKIGPYRPSGEVSVSFMIVMVGARVAVNPVQLGDFLVGIFGLDPAGDDPDPQDTRRRPVRRREDRQDGVLLPAP